VNLYTLSTAKFPVVFGTPEAPIERSDLQIIGQKPDCSSFLVLSGTAYTGLVAKASIPSGYDFTYCQSWGLTINDNVITRVKKELRTRFVSEIKVTTTVGNTFDGDEDSQTRMARAITAMNATSTLETPWKLADNTTILASVAELGEALSLAGQAQSDLWFI